MSENNKKCEVPIWHKMTLSIEEAMAYSGIGKTKLYEMTNKEDCPYIVWVGNKRMIKREIFESYIAKAYSI